MMVNYTVEEIAQKLKISKKTVLREIKRGKLKTTKAGRRHLIGEKEIAKYLGKGEENFSQLLSNFFDSRKSEMVSLLQNIVSMPSETTELFHEKRLARFIKKTFDKWGIRSVVYETQEAVAVKATVGFAEEGVLLDAPLDTLPPGDPEKWIYPPFDGVIKKGKMYGRGSADAKAGIVCMMYTALFFRTYINEDDFRIEIVFDGGEQNGSFLGIKEVIKRGLPVKYGIIGYAGDDDDLLLGARGYHRYTFLAKGEAVHTGSRYKKGVNAISKMVNLINEAENITFPESKNKLFSYGCRLTFSTIEGGRAINMIPDECIARVDIRTVPEVSKSDLDNLLRSIISGLKKADKDSCITFKYDVGEEAYVVDKNDKFVVDTASIIYKHIGEKPGMTASGPAHIGNLLHRYGIKCLVWGPVGHNVHSYDEYVEIDSLPVTSKIYAEILVRYFGIDSSGVRYGKNL